MQQKREKLIYSGCTSMHAACMHALKKKKIQNKKQKKAKTQGKKPKI
jgi:hypothetical protein